MVYNTFFVEERDIGIGPALTMSDGSGTGGSSEPFDGCPERINGIVLPDVIYTETVGMVVYSGNLNGLGVKVGLVLDILGEGTRSTEEKKYDYE
jgi:hypothetical protein